MSGVWLALGLTLFAGMATGIGSAIAFFAKRTNYRFLSVSTGFSAGVMLYVSFVEILFKGGNALSEAYGDYWGHWVNAGSFFGGILLIAVIDNIIPAAKNPHETHAGSERAPLKGGEAAIDPGAAQGIENQAGDIHDHAAHRNKLHRMGLFTALAIAIHNLPEGLATFLAAMHDPGLGIAIAVAVALHNIPEGISVSVPIYYATGKRGKAFAYSLLSGLAEPVGALIGYLLILYFVGVNGDGRVIPPEVMGMAFGGIAGVMVYISLDELLPTSRTYGKGHDSILGLVFGMGVMALSLLLMK